MTQSLAELFPSPWTLRSAFLRQQRINEMREEMDWFLGLINGFLSRNMRNSPNRRYHFSGRDSLFLRYTGDKINFTRGVATYVPITAKELPLDVMEEAYANFLVGIWELLSKAGYQAEKIEEFLKSHLSLLGNP